MAIETTTRTDVRQRLAEAMNDDLVRGTATGGTAGTLIDTDILEDNYDDDSLNGAFLYMITGDNAGEERPITDFVSSTGTITVAYDFSNTCDSGDTYEVHRKRKAEQYNSAINQAVRASRWAHMQDKRDKGILLNSNLLNPLFQYWNAAVDTPTDWTNSSGVMSQVVVDPEQVYGKQQTYEAVVHSTGTDLYLEVTDGTTTVKSNATGVGPERLTVEITPEGTAVTVRIGVDGAASLTLSRDSNFHPRGDYSVTIVPNAGTGGSVDSVYAPTYVPKYEYPLATGIHSVHKIEVDKASPSDSNPRGGFSKERISTRAYEFSADVGGSQELIFKSDWFLPPPNKLVTISALQAPDLISADTEAIDINSEVVELYALYRLQLPFDRALALTYREAWDDLKDEQDIKYPAGSRMVERF